MDEFLQLFATGLGNKLVEKQKATEFAIRGDDQTEQQARRGKPTVPTSILQLKRLARVFKPVNYANPFSPTNPNGSYQTAYALYQLANQVPNLSTYFEPSYDRFDRLWDSLVNSAGSDVDFTTGLIDRARQQFRSARLSSMAGIGIADEWWPVFADPADWYIMVKDQRNLIDLEIDPQQAQTTSDGFTILSDEDDKQSDDSKDDTIQLDKLDNTARLKLKVLQVNFKRPWLNWQIVQRRDWKINGVKRAYFSNGRTERNRGVLPLVIKSMLVGTSVQVTGAFSSEIVQNLQSSSSRQLVKHGSIVLNSSDTPDLQVSKQGSQTTFANDLPQIIGYVCQMVPISPFLPRPNRE